MNLRLQLSAIAACAFALALTCVDGSLYASDEAAKAAGDSEKAATLEPVKYEEFVRRIAANKSAKFTLVDCWATWCGPCKDAFPHVVAMHKKYSGKGLSVISMSFDDPTNKAHVADAKKFLAEKKAVFTNFLLDEEMLETRFEKFDLISIPAAFLFGPDGKLLKRFTGDDPNNQFTYDDVEKAVVALLDGKALPKDDAPSPKKSSKDD
jgi:thiol-disulfide isomerase/thioredoxin